MLFIGHRARKHFDRVRLFAPLRDTQNHNRIGRCRRIKSTPTQERFILCGLNAIASSVIVKASEMHNSAADESPESKLDSGTNTTVLSELTNADNCPRSMRRVSRTETNASPMETDPIIHALSDTTVDAFDPSEITE